MGEPGRLDLLLKCELASCEVARLAALQYLAPYQPTPKAVYRLEVALEEVLMNQIMHAFKDSPACDQTLQFSMQVHGDNVALHFADKGVAFNPLERAAPQLPTSLDDAVPGGLGIFLTRKFAKELSYVREGDTNCLTVIMALHDSASEQRSNPESQQSCSA
jgi:anti-sigma regulatory factor (Ser/Thr protein kinase)